MLDKWKVFYVETKENKNMQKFTRGPAGGTLIALNHVKAEGRALVRYLDEDPGGTEHVWVIWSELSAFTQTDQSELETKAGSVLFLLRHEREEFSINLFHLVLWSCFTEHCCVWETCQLSCFSVPPLLEPRACSHRIKAAAEADVYFTNKACTYTVKYTL